MRAAKKRARAMRQAKRAGRSIGLMEAAAVVTDKVRLYPPDVFIPPPPGKHGKTVDACSAAALRRVAVQWGEELRQRARRGTT